MTLPLPQTVDEFDHRNWSGYEPYFAELQARELTPATYRQWLADWSHLAKLLREAMAAASIAKSLDTTDAEKEAAYLHMVSQVLPPAQIAEQGLNLRLLALDPSDEDLRLVLRQVREAVKLFREANIPIRTTLQKLANDYDKITGQLAADWGGETRNLSQLSAFLQSPDRATREGAWRTTLGLWAGVRERLDALYGEMLGWRVQMARNADLPDYRAFAFRERGRFDYTPEDCLTFHAAIAEVVVPAARRILEDRRERLGLEVLRPWDEEVEPAAAPLLPYRGQAELVAHSQAIFNQVDGEFGRYFSLMAQDGLLDLDTRPGKALGGYCTTLPIRQRPFIFMNGVGAHRDVQTMLHEAGHAFHAFEAMRHQPLIWQRQSPMEFNEVASMAMELLSSPYLTHAHGGFYTPAEAARARIHHLEKTILFLPYMAVVDSFQHWVYTHVTEAADPRALDAQWDALWLRFMPVTDWSGFEAERATGWHRKLHIFRHPFYYIEYGMAQVGALQVWRNSLRDQAQAVADYRRALRLGATRTLPELYAAAGAEFRFDRQMLSELISLAGDVMADLREVAAQG